MLMYTNNFIINCTIVNCNSHRQVTKVIKSGSNNEMYCVFFIIFNSVYPFDYNLLTISYLEHSVTILNYEQTYWNKYLWRWRTPPKKIFLLSWVCYTFKRILILSVLFIFIYITFCWNIISSAQTMKLTYKKCIET